MNTIELSQNGFFLGGGGSDGTEFFFLGHTWFPCSGGFASATAACRRCSAPAAGSGRWPWTPARDFRCADSPQHRPSAAPVNARKIHTDKERWHVLFADVHHSISVSVSGGWGPLRVIKVVRLWARSTMDIGFIFPYVIGLQHFVQCHKCIQVWHPELHGWTSTNERNWNRMVEDTGSGDNYRATFPQVRKKEHIFTATPHLGQADSG